MMKSTKTGNNGAMAFETTSQRPPDLVPLIESIRWGTQGALYQIRDCQATLDTLPSHRYLLLRKAYKLVAARITIRKSLCVDGHVTQAFYHSMFSVDPSEQGRGYGKLLARHTLDYLREELGHGGFIYAYIEEGNARSAAIAASLGYRKFAQFFAHPISRLFPQDSPRVGLLKEGDQHLAKQLLHERYSDHALTDFDLSFKTQEYWALYERGMLVAGAQVLQQLWEIKRLPGVSGALALHLVPYLPLVNKLFCPHEWRFLKIGNIYFPKGRADAFFKLVSALLYQFRINTAAVFIDHNSSLYKELRSTQRFGLLNLLMQTKVNVWGFFDDLLSELALGLHHRPLVISPIDI